jgi:hypothetical protein
LLPGPDVDRAQMRRTLQAVLDHWDLRQTWGWDWPMLAMSAARLGEPALAVDFLLPKDAKNFQFGVSGMTPRIHVLGDDAPHAAGSVDGPGYRRAAETYFPSNGSLLLAVGLLASLEAKSRQKARWVGRHGRDIIPGLFGASAWIRQAARLHCAHPQLTIKSRELS